LRADGLEPGEQFCRRIGDRMIVGPGAESVTMSSSVREVTKIAGAVSLSGTASGASRPFSSGSISQGMLALAADMAHQIAGETKDMNVVVGLVRPLGQRLACAASSSNSAILTSLALPSRQCSDIGGNVTPFAPLIDTGTCGGSRAWSELAFSACFVGMMW
jgi:hypothetical protein